jgi:methanethiol S-methyltransferase
MAKRLAVFAYGLVSYLVFFLTFVYAVGFIGNLYVPKSMDSTARTSFLPALVVDALLLLIFAVQHSLMAQPAFKEVLTRFIPAAAERSTCVLCSSLLLIVVFAFWQPIGGVVSECHQSSGSERHQRGVRLRFRPRVRGHALDQPL